LLLFDDGFFKFEQVAFVEVEEAQECLALDVAGLSLAL